MKKEVSSKHLYAFGFGVALIIPFIIFFRYLHAVYHFSNLFVLIISFLGLLFIINQIAEFKPLHNLWILGFQGIVLALKFKAGISAIELGFLLFAVAVFFITLSNKERLLPLYTRWMVVAGWIGKAVSGTVLAAVYYLVFAPVGITLRLIGKDLLDRKIEKNKQSHWIARDTANVDPKRYEQQF